MSEYIDIYDKLRYYERRLRKKKKYEQLEKLLDYYKRYNKRVNISEISRRLDVTRPTVYKYIKMRGLQRKLVDLREEEMKRIKDRLPKKLFICMRCRKQYYQPECPIRCDVCGLFSEFGIKEGRWIRPARGTSFEDNSSDIF